VSAALPEQQDGSGDLNEESTQHNLDGFVKSVPKWSKEGLLEHIVDFVVSDDQISDDYTCRLLSNGCCQPFRIVDKKQFRVLLKYQRPVTKDSDIPHRTKLRDEVILKANEAIERLKAHFKVCFGHLIFDSLLNG
jgi:hypothetical protein